MRFGVFIRSVRASKYSGFAILEPLELMDPVRAGAAGTVPELVVANNEPAEQGAVLLWLDPDSGGGEASGGGDGAGPGR
jgi:hypothetical protein